MPFSPAAITAFGEVIHLDTRRNVNGVIDKLRGSVGLDLPYFQDAAKSLPVLKASFSTPNRGKITFNKEVADVRRIGGGTYGTIWQDVRGDTAVYKRTSNQTKGRSLQSVENVYRENYVEGFIQAVLGADTFSGMSVGKLEGIYRDASIRRRGTRRRRSSGSRRTSSNRPRYDVRRASSEPLNTMFYYRMEYIKYTFTQAIEKLYSDNHGPIPLDDISNFFGLLGGTLAEFDETYGFRHCDLHSGNIMFSDTMGLKIIDFGKSCFTMDGVVYAKNKAVCESYDLLIFLASVRELYFGFFSAEVRALINYFFTDDTDGSNIYDVIEEYHSDHEAQGAVFHYFYNETSIDLRGDARGYPWNVVVNGRTLYDKFLAGSVPKKVAPQHFFEVWSDPRGPRPPLPPAPLPPLPASSSSSEMNRSALFSPAAPAP